MPQPTAVTPTEARAMLDQISTLIKKFTDGSIVVKDQPVEVRDTIQEIRARNQAAVETIVNQHREEGSAARSLGLSDVPEPRRQRKERHIAPRACYVVEPITTGEQLDAVRNLAPATTAILVYIAGHPRVTVPDIEANLDIKRKTIVNAVSTLNLKKLIRSERV